MQPASLVVPQTTTPIDQGNLQESQEWVVFTPSQADSSNTDITQTASGHTSHTAGLSRISDFGSLLTNIRSGNSQEIISPQEEDGELDSLDDSLQAFGEPSTYRTPTSKNDHADSAVLPAHDGLGSFQASSSPIREQLWQYEQYNPKRKFEGHHRRRSSVQRRLDTIEETESRNIDEEKRIRIESWRLDQSRALLDEIENETRRQGRRQAFLSTKGTRTARSQQLSGVMPPEVNAWDDARSQENDSNEPFWRRITRKFIRDFIGIDESLLPVILGETLAEEISDQSFRPAQRPGFANASVPSSNSLVNGSWHDRLLHRIARELGILVDQLTTHPSTFNTYLHTSNISTEYAGMSTTDATSKVPKAGAIEPDSSVEPMKAAPGLPPTFNPTLNQHTSSINTINAASWGLDDEPNSPSSPQLHRNQTSSSIRTNDSEKAHDYWERDLDFKMVFGYFKDRFSSRRQPPASTISPDPSRRAAIIRQHHPLVTRNHASASNRLSASRLTSQHIYHGLRRPSSSCASQSLRSSQKDRGSLVRSGRGSSRNYWDIGGSVGSESGVLSTAGGGMGAWGEV